MRARDNPFSVDRIAAVPYHPIHGTVDEILARLEQLNNRAAIIGPNGSGKTMLLEQLQQTFERRGVPTKLIFVNDTSPLTPAQCRKFLSELSPQELVLLDGADAIRRSCWLLFRRHTIRHAAGLVVTSHRPGLLPTLVECAPTPALLQQIVDELAPPDHCVAPALLDDLYRRHEGNLRTCLRDLYDVYARET
jgi:hypothetical protein